MWDFGVECSRVYISILAVQGWGKAWFALQGITDVELGHRGSGFRQKGA